MHIHIYIYVKCLSDLDGARDGHAKLAPVRERFAKFGHACLLKVAPAGELWIRAQPVQRNEFVPQKLWPDNSLRHRCCHLVCKVVERLAAEKPSSLEGWLLKDKMVQPSLKTG